MKIEKGMIFIGNANNELLEIIEINDKIVRYRCFKNNRIFIYGRKAFEHCNLSVVNN